MAKGRDLIKLSVRNVCKTFRLRGIDGGEEAMLQVLKNVSFDVHQGEIVSLIGESGCGKTTLLRLIQGLIRLDLAAKTRVRNTPSGCRSRRLGGYG